MLFSGVYKLWEDPLIVSCMVGSENHALAINQPADVIVHESWVSTWRSLPAMFRFRLEAREAGKRAHFMACAADSNRVLRTALLPGGLINISIYIDHKLYGIRDVEKQFDAIYPARMEYYKRLHLASAVKSL